MAKRTLARRAVFVLIAMSLWSCGGDQPGRLDPPATAHTDFVPARAQSPYADVLAECAFVYVRGGDNDTGRACPMSVLPLLGQEHAEVRVAEIMSQTLVSHEWMAVRFEQLLEELPEELLQLFQGVTAVVIGADIRPSYYWSATGAIYLDPARLWLTEEEKNSISRAPDFRSDFDRDLQFKALWRYVKNGDYAWRNYSLTSPETGRELSAIVAPMAALLFHELAHANDYIPPAMVHLIDPQQTVLNAAVELQSNNISARLRNDMPLNSALLFGLANVMFRGDTASEAQRALSAEQVGLAFADDTANDTYAYTSSAEDTAMLFEELMMRHHFDIGRDIAFTERPAEDNAACDDHVVRWGRRGRLGEPGVLARIALILPLFLDRNDVSEYLGALPSPEPLAPGLGWCANLDLSESGVGILATPRTDRPLPEQDQRRFDGHPHH